MTEEKGAGAGIPCRSDACGEKKKELRPSWRGLVISVLAAAILSVAATLLLGGAGNLTGRAVSDRCGGGAVCVLPGGDAGSGVRAPRSVSGAAFPAAAVSRSDGRSDPAAAIPAADLSTGERSAR